MLYFLLSFRMDSCSDVFLNYFSSLSYRDHVYVRPVPRVPFTQGCVYAAGIIFMGNSWPSPLHISDMFYSGVYVTTVVLVHKSSSFIWVLPFILVTALRTRAFRFPSFSNRFAFVIEFYSSGPVRSFIPVLCPFSCRWLCSRFLAVS